MEPVLGKLSPPGRLQNTDRYSISCSWSLLNHSLNLQTPHQGSPRASKTIMWSSRTPQRALQQTPRTEFRAPEHLEELSSSLQGLNFELPNSSRSSLTASQDRIPSSRTSRGAVEQPPRNEFRAPKQASQEESKQIKGNQASKQSINQACNQTSKRSNKQTSKRANEQSSTRPNEQTIKQEVGGVPRRSAQAVPYKSTSPHRRSLSISEPQLQHSPTNRHRALQNATELSKYMIHI